MYIFVLLMEETKSKYCSCLYYSANALSRTMTKIADEEFGKLGLSSSHARLLTTVNENQGIQPKGLSCELQLTPSTVTRLIEKMEYRGLVKRKSIGRSTEVYSTPEGLKLQEKLNEAWKNLHNRYSEILGKEEGAKLASDIYDAAQKLE